jgi:transposase
MTDEEAAERPMTESARDERSDEEQLARLRDAAKQLGVDSLRDGSWFRKIVAAHVKKHAAEVHADHWDRVYPGLDVEERARRQIKRVAAKTVTTAVAAATLSSAGELASLFSEGLAAPVGIPATIIAMTVEGAYTSLLQIDLACDLASIYGVPFNPDDVGEVATLFALALELDVKKKASDGDGEGDEDGEAHRGFASKLMELEDGDLAKKIGRKLLEDAVIKNVLPVVGIAVAARWNYLGTRRLAAAVRKYVRYRRALRTTLDRLDLSGVGEPGVLVEGAWLLATVDGDAAHEEVMAVAAVVDHLSPEARRVLALDNALGEDEEEWFEALPKLPRAMHDPLMDVLYLIAATDRMLCPSERRFLRRVAKALGREVDLARVDLICRHLARGEDLPAGVLTSMANGSARATAE